MARVNRVRCSQPRATSARRPPSHSVTAPTDAPAASYQAHAASRSATLTARFAMPVTVIEASYGSSSFERGPVVALHDRPPRRRHHTVDRSRLDRTAFVGGLVDGEGELQHLDA